MQSLSEYTKLCVFNDLLTSFDLENNHENLEEEEDNPFDYFLQSTACLLGYYNNLSYNTAGNTMSTCVCQRYDPQYYLQRKLGLNTKRKQDIVNKSNQKENKNKSQIPYEYKVRDQVLLETPGILRKFSTPRTGPYPVTNVYKNGTIRIQKGKRTLYQKE
jgi:hypothetical protein